MVNGVAQSCCATEARRAELRSMAALAFGGAESCREAPGKDTPMGRLAQPEEAAPAYVFLASEVDSS